MLPMTCFFFCFSSRRRHTRYWRDWSSDVCSSDLTYYSHIEAAVDHKPHFTMDDGADVISVLHSARREQLGDVIAGTEETTTGVIRLKALEAEGKLGFPIIAVNEA